MKTKEKSKKNMRVELTDKQNKIFNEYAFTYENDSNKHARVELQRYVYGKLKTKTDKNTCVEKLLDMLIKDIESQYTMKEHMENKAGFLIALWGVLLSIILQCDLIDILIAHMTRGIDLLLSISLLIILVSMGVATLYCLSEIITSKNYSRYNFEERELNFKSAVDDKDIFMVAMLEAYTNIWEKNEDTNEQKADMLEKSTKCLRIYIFVIAVIFLLR